VQPVCRADRLAAICVPIAYQLCALPRHVTGLAFTIMNFLFTLDMLYEIEQGV
jgi:hypothetical protein